MKNRQRAIVLSLLTLSLCGTAGAQSQGTSSATRSTDQSTMMQQSDSTKAQHLNRASKIIGANVQDPQGKKIGDIKDIVLDRNTGQVSYAVVSFGGVLGMGKKYVSIPWKAFQQGTARDTFVLNADSDTLAKAPSFESTRWPDMASSHWTTDVDKYWQNKMPGHAGTSSGSSGGSTTSGSSTSK